MLRALILDFDGVIVDSEPIILRLTQQIAAQEGWELSDEEYYRDYLALDDRGIVERLYASHGRAISPQRCQELVEEKGRWYAEIIKDGLPALPGSAEFVRAAARQYPLAIASGSFRQEIEHLLQKLDLRGHFQALATADDCARSKPDPEVYLKAVERLGRTPAFQNDALRPAECLAIEDAPGGVEAAHAAGLKCLALAHSRPADELREADWIFHGFGEINLEAIAREFN